MAMPTDGRPHLRRTAAALALACAAATAVASPALAAPLSVQVVNSRGTPQAALLTGGGTTDGHGRAVIDVAPGESVGVTRGAEAPEGAAGISYSVPNPVPAGTVTVTLPALPGVVSPGIDGDERWLFDRVNQERAARGLAALGLSSTLSRASDAYAHHLHRTGAFSHTALATPGVRATDQGWPVPGGAAVGETLALSPNRELTLDGWKGSPGHWTLLMMAGLDSAGVARAGNTWVMMPAQCAVAAERCGLGEDPASVPPGSSDGPPARAPGPWAAPPAEGGGPPDAGRAERRARVRLTLRRKARRLMVTVRVSQGQGRVVASLRHGDRRGHVRVKKSGGLYRLRARAPRRGRWTLTVKFRGAEGWADRRLLRRTIRFH